MAVLTGAATNPAPAPDFVKSTRDSKETYIPVGSKAPARPSEAKSPAELKAMEDSLEATRSRLQAEGAAARNAGATPAPTPETVPASGTAH